MRIDGRKLHNAYLFEVRSRQNPSETGDFYKTRATIPADEAFRPPFKDGGCPPVNGRAPWRACGAPRAATQFPIL